MPKPKDTQKFGGKGTGLIWLSQNTDLGFNVPEFEIIDTSYHEEFLKQPSCTESLEKKCLELADKFKEKSVAVRSSAVVSEDNEELSGAGIYDTFFLYGNELKPNTLVDAVLKVYESVNSPRAVQYRKENGLDDERMAVVVQKLSHDIGFYNGVTQSRLQAVPRIVPVSWSYEVGAVVEGKGSKIKTVYLRKVGRGKESYYKTHFISDNSNHGDAREVNEVIIPIILGLKERYGKDFEAEFSADFEREIVNMLQIRPLTNISDEKVVFPKKEILFTSGTSGCCMGAGEYIGPWVHKDDVNMMWDEPEQYAFIIPSMPQTVEKDAKLRSWLEVQKGKPVFDYNRLTPNKRVIVVTKRLHYGSHAMTIANEKGIICMGKYQEKDELTEHLKERNIKYIHLVCNGLIGRAYEATEQEAKEFAEKMKLK